MSITTPTPEPGSLTWRKDGSGCTWEALTAEFRKGRQAEVKTSEAAEVIHQGPLALDGGWWIGSKVLITPCATSVTVWLVPEWAQGYEDRARDARLVATEDGRVWRPRRRFPDGAMPEGNEVIHWVQRTHQWATATTEELTAMGARPLVDRDGNAVFV